MTQWTSDEQEAQKDITDRLAVLNTEQEERLAQHRAETLKKSYVNLVAYPINPEDLALIPKDDALAASAVVFYKQGKDIRLAAVNPEQSQFLQLMKRLQQKYGVAPDVYVVSHRSLKAAVARYLPERLSTGVPRDEMRVADEGTDQSVKNLANLKDLGARITSLPPTEILTVIVQGAVISRASDIHIEPTEHDARLRYRIDGVLQDVTAFAATGYKLVLSRVKVLAKLKLNIRDVPQDGSFVLRVGDTMYDMRVSVLPGGYGETIVIRLLSRETRAIKVTDLGMKQRDYDVVQRELKRANGMILVTGPTGSGKTTTLASFVMEINQPELKIITLEDPIEYRLPGVTQTQVDASSGYTFARGLRSILRQDPDMILVGEMRDSETAETAVHASLTGHLVFSTLHTNNAPGAIPRLVNMGVKPFVLAPALNVVIAQRLVRVACQKCAEEYSPAAPIRERIADVMKGVRKDVFDPAVLKDKKLKFLQSKGCAQCGHTGYKGRLGVFEIFTVEGELEDLVLQGADEFKIRNAALKQGMTTITQDAYLKVIDQVTTIEEVERVSEE